MSRKSLDKGLLKNILRHTDAHNKIQEQNEMWKQWELKKQSRKRTHSPEKVRGYMRSDAELPSLKVKKSDSLKWNRMLLEYEETCNDRWGHSGYKELYPEEFKECENHSNSESDGDSSPGEETKERSTSRKKRKAKNKKGLKKKKKKRRKANSDSDMSDCETTKRRITVKKDVLNDKHNRTNEKKKKEKRKKS